MAKKKGKGFGAKPKAVNSNGNADSYVAKAAGFKRGGGIGAATQTPFGGPAAVKRLDRPGRKRGGGIGADTSPMSSAAKPFTSAGGD